MGLRQGRPVHQARRAKAKSELAVGRDDRRVVHVPDLQRLAPAAADCRADQGPDQRSRSQHGDPADRVRHRCCKRQLRRIPSLQPGLERRRRSRRGPVLAALHRGRLQLRQVHQPGLRQTARRRSPNLDQAKRADATRTPRRSSSKTSRWSSSTTRRRSPSSARTSRTTRRPTTVSGARGTTPKSGARSRLSSALLRGKDLCPAAAARFTFARYGRWGSLLLTRSRSLGRSVVGCVSHDWLRGAWGLSEGHGAFWFVPGA